MAKRRNIRLGKSRRLFKKTAGLNKIHPRNKLRNNVMRGGIRL